MATTYGKRIATDNLVLSLDAGNSKSYPGTGTTWYDTSGNGYDIVHVNSPTFTSSGIKTFTYNGTSQYGYIKSKYFSSGYSLENITVECIFNTTYSDTTYNTNWAFIDFDRSDWFNFFVDATSDKLAFSGKATNDGSIGSGNFDIEGNTSVNDGEWYHGAVVYSVNDQKIYFYLNGESDGTFTATTTLGSLGSTLTRYGFISDGSEATSQNGSRNSVYFEGDIALLRYYETDLSATQIKQNFEVTASRFGL